MQADGFGNFTQDFAGGRSAADRLNSVTLILDGVSGGPASILPTGNNLFAVKWYSNYGTTLTQVTGWASVPEPGTLLGAGIVTLMGLGYTWRRRRATS